MKQKQTNSGKIWKKANGFQNDWIKLCEYEEKKAVLSSKINGLVSEGMFHGVLCVRVLIPNELNFILTGSLMDRDT